MKNVLLIGGAGYVGSVITSHFLKLGYKVRVLDKFVYENQNAIQVMFYRTQHVRADGLTTQDECTPLLFENEKLIAWGDGAYSSYQQS